VVRPIVGGARAARLAQRFPPDAMLPSPPDGLFGDWGERGNGRGGFTKVAERTDPGLVVAGSRDTAASSSDCAGYFLLDNRARLGRGSGSNGAETAM